MKLSEIYNHYEVDENGCWNWTRSKNKGYGVVNAMNRTFGAHRVSYELSIGPTPAGASVCHRCDNPACINPEHLWLGSHAENMADMKSKGRNSTPPVSRGDDHWLRKYPDRVPMGEQVRTSKLTAEQVTALRIDYCAGAGRAELASKYGVSPLSIHDYVSGGAWAHLLGKDGSPTLADLQATAKKNSKPSATLTPEIVREIRTELSRGALGIDLAAKYGVHKATISDIKLRKIWADVD